MAGLRADGIVAPMVLDGAMDGPAFRAYIEQVLVPDLREGDVATCPRIRAGFARRSAPPEPGVLYLPPYSPDLNPIEQVFAKMKALLRQAAARTADTLWETIGALLEVVTLEVTPMADYFRTCSGSVLSLDPPALSHVTTSFSRLVNELGPNPRPTAASEPNILSRSRSHQNRRKRNLRCNLGVGWRRAVLS